MIEFVFTSPDRGEKMVFADVATALLAAQDEVDRWREGIRQSGGAITTGPEELTAYLVPLHVWEEVVRDLNGIRRRASSDTDDHSIQNNGMVLFSSVVGGALTLTLRTVGRIPAHYAAIAEGLFSGPIEWNSDDAVKGILLYDRFKRTVGEFEENKAASKPLTRILEINERIDRLSATVKNLDEMVISINNMVQQRATENEALATVQRAELSESQRKIDVHVKETSKFVEEKILEQQRRFNDVMTSANETVSSWISSRTEDRKLTAPAKLWLDRSDHHRKEARTWRLWSLAAGIVGLLLTFLVANESLVIARKVFSSAVMGKEKDISLPIAATSLRPTFHYELIFAATATLLWLTLFLWTMRVLVRLYTTEHHLSIDASTRSAMNETYLGLIEAKAASEEDRSIVLSALFRPVIDGMIKDDGLPNIAPAAVISGMLGSNKP